MHCLNFPDGVGCLKYERACIKAKKSKLSKDTDISPYFDMNLDCTCLICACQCSVVYFRHEGERMAKHAKEELLERLNTKPQSKIDGFFGYTNAIADLANERLKK